MKIFNKENDKEKVYVQKKDLMMLKSADYFFKYRYVNFVEKNYNCIDNTSSDSNDLFIEFDEKDEVDFFKDIDFIIDYKKVRNYSLKDIKEEMNEIKEEIRNLEFRCISSDHEEKERIFARIQILEYKCKSYIELIKIKKNQKKILFPHAIDSNGLKVGDKDYSKYQFSALLDPNKIALHRKDGSPFRSGEDISQSFYFYGIKKYLCNMSENNEFLTQYETETYMSSDNKQLIVEFKFKPYKKSDVLLQSAKETFKGLVKAKKSK